MFRWRPASPRAPRPPGGRPPGLLLAAVATAALAAAALVAASPPAEAPDAAADPVARARRLHLSRRPVIDLHCDTVYQLFTTPYPIAAAPRGHGRGEITLRTLAAGGYAAQVFALWVPPKLAPSDAEAAALAEKLHAAFLRMLADGRPALAPAISAVDVRRLSAEGRTAALLAMEGAHGLGSEAAALRVWRSRGLRILGLTWNNSNAFAEGVGDPRPGRPGLTAEGEALVRLADELGVVLDLAHASEATFWATLRRSARPVIVSHAGAKALRPHRRNLSDEQIRALACSGGVVGVVYHSPFLRRGPGRATVRDVADHIEHIRRVGGIDALALGSDFDGFIKTPADLADAGEVVNLTAELLRRGWNEAEVEKVLGGNALRVLAAADGPPARRTGCGRAPATRGAGPR